MVKALETDGWSVGKDGRITRTREGREQVNASVPLARVTLDGKPRWVNVRDIVAAKHLGALPANHAVVAKDGNPARTRRSPTCATSRAPSRPPPRPRGPSGRRSGPRSSPGRPRRRRTPRRLPAQKAEAVANGAPPKPGGFGAWVCRDGEVAKR